MSGTAAMGRSHPKDIASVTGATPLSSALTDTIPNPQLVFVTMPDGARFPAAPVGWVSDYEDDLLPEQEDSLNRLIAEFERETTIQIAVVTIQQGWVIRENFDTLVLALHHKWGVGVKGKNNGIVVGISTGLRRIRISNGEGIVPYLSDNETKRIIDEIILPSFREENYYKGVCEGLLALFEALRSR